MRGKETRTLTLFGKMRITPAHAGKSRAIFSRTRAKQDHPRTCGEKGGAGKTTTASNGSPPHMRGKAVRSYREIYIEGITPAHAGKSYTYVFAPSKTGDHPRTCGEK